METFSANWPFVRGNSPVPGEFPAQRPVTMSFDVFFDLRLNNWLSKQSWGRWFETLSCPLWRHCNDNPLDQHWLDIEPTHLCPIDVISMLMQWSLLSGLPPVYRQTITWTSTDILWIGPLEWGAVSDLSLISDLNQKFKHDLLRVKSELK